MKFLIVKVVLWLFPLSEGVIDHFTAVCLVAWPLNDSEAGVGLVLIETSLLFSGNFLLIILISMKTTSLT